MTCRECVDTDPESCLSWRRCSWRIHYITVFVSYTYWRPSYITFLERSLHDLEWFEAMVISHFEEPIASVDVCWTINITYQIGTSLALLFSQDEVHSTIRIKQKCCSENLRRKVPHSVLSNRGLICSSKYNGAVHFFFHKSPETRISQTAKFWSWKMRRKLR